MRSVRPSSSSCAQIRYSDQQKIHFAVVIGPDEAAQGLLALKDLGSGAQERLALEEAAARIR
jgi:histidyl-tRNA synthetase